MKWLRAKHAVNGAAIEVHRALGPGLLESLYERALIHEFGLRGIGFTSQVDLPARYKDIDLGSHYRLDLVVEIPSSSRSKPYSRCRRHIVRNC